jgi:streptogramin lyase
MAASAGIHARARAVVAFIVTVATLACALGSVAIAQVATEFPGSTGAPRGIASGPDGNVWFAQDGPDAIGRVTPAGVVTLFTAGISVGANPERIVLGPDGNLWFAEEAGRIGRITPAGVVTEFSAGITGKPAGITVGPDGNLWFTEIVGDKIGRITTTGVVTEFSTGITPSSQPYGITAGPDGNLWFTEFQFGRIARITTAGVVTEFTAGITAGTRIVDIVAGPDGNLWFTEVDAGKIGRITPAGVVTEFTVGAPSSPWGITVGPDGNFWFGNEGGVTGIGRMTPSGVVTFFTAGFTGTVYYAATGPDGNMWFTEPCCARVGRLVPTATTPTTTALASSVNPSTLGQSVTFTATVTGASPTGTVQFRDGVTSLASATLSAGLATFTTSSLSVGSHPISAVYSGDPNNQASTSPVLIQTVNALGPPSPGSSQPVPTISEWGIALLVVLLGALAVTRIRSPRKK